MTIRRPRIGSIGYEGLASLRHRNYRLFFAGHLVSVAGTWMQTVAMGWLVLELTGDPLLIGVVVAAQFTPVLLLGLFGGLVADGLPKRRTMLITQVISLGLALVLFGLAFSGVVEVWHLIVVAIGIGLTNAVEMPVRQAFAIEMVDRRNIANAVALNSAIFNIARIIGPALAGVVIGVADLSVVFLVNALSYLGMIWALTLIRSSEMTIPAPFARPRTMRAVAEVLGEGLAYIRQTELVRSVIVALAVVATFGMNFQVVIPPLARDVLLIGPTGFGFLRAASGLGSLAAAATIAIRGARPAFIGFGALGLGLALVLLGVSRAYPVSLLAMFIAGFGAIALAATVNTTIQLAVPDQLRGRVMSVYTTVFAGSAPLGGLLMGGLASSIGVASAIAIGGVASGATGIGVLIWLRRRASVAVAPEPEPAMAPEPRMAPEPTMVSASAASTGAHDRA
jgi:MFS family permease